MPKSQHQKGSQPDTVELDIDHYEKLVRKSQKMEEAKATLEGPITHQRVYSNSYLDPSEEKYREGGSTMNAQYISDSLNSSKKKSTDVANISNSSESFSGGTTKTDNNTGIKQEYAISLFKDFCFISGLTALVLLMIVSTLMITGTIDLLLGSALLVVLVMSSFGFLKSWHGVRKID